MNNLTHSREVTLNNIYCGDCFELMQSIADKSVNMILCDLPY